MLLAVGGCGPARPIEPSPARPVVTGTDPADIHLANLRQLTFDGDNGEAYFNAEGSKLIFQSNRGGRDCDKIWTMKVDGSDKRMVSPDRGANTCSFFTPAGDIVFASTYGATSDAGASTSGGASAAGAPAAPAGSSAAASSPARAPASPVTSSFGTGRAPRRGRGSSPGAADDSEFDEQCPPRPQIEGAHYMWPLFPYDIFTARADGSHARRLTDNPGYDAEPIVSADGKRIVFGSKREGDFDVYVMDSDGSNLRRLTDTEGYDGGPWFSPDGSKIVWRAWHPQTEGERAQWRDCMERDYIVPFPLDLWVMNADGSGKLRLTRNGATNWAPSWHPDGRRIVFSSNMDDWREDIKAYGHNFELYLINVDGSGLERLTHNDVFDSFPMFSPDGSKLVFASNRNPDKPRATDILVADWLERKPAPRRDFAHRLSVKLEPERHRIQVRDTIVLPDAKGAKLRFRLRAGLDPKCSSAGVKLRRVRDDLAGDSGSRLTGASEGHEAATGTQSFALEVPAGTDKVVIDYAGVIDEALEAVGKDYARGFKTTSGAIGGDGVYLAGESYWYPVFADQGALRSTLEVELPAQWAAISQGARTANISDGTTRRVSWESRDPQEEIFLVASRLSEFSRPAGAVEDMVFLHEPDPALAEKYLDAAEIYLPMYAKLIGPYPYSKLAVVENFWETGFGMPSFTLLGPKVIRFPFILHSSFPHEILHNWWGNGVFPDPDQGNWSEGLTAYLADHLIKEQREQGAEYRRDLLQKYSDYVSAAADFPLCEFRSRHSSSTEAVGYGKAAMFFHMLRLELGDDTFVAGLRDFYARNKFATAGFDQLRASFERASGKSLATVFDQWTRVAGAPALAVADVRAQEVEGGFRLGFELSQSGGRLDYELQVPVAITMEGRKQAFQTAVALTSAEHSFSLDVPARPVRIDVDPEFDVFRRLDAAESPPALSSALGAKEMLLLLPSRAAAPELAAWREFARVLAAAGPERSTTMLDSDIEALPTDRAVLVLGWDNAFAQSPLSYLADYGVSSGAAGVRIGDQSIARRDHALVLVTKNAAGQALGLITCDSTAALPGLGAKLPHYHKYGWLAFAGTEPTNVGKGQWALRGSPMSVAVAPPSPLDAAAAPSTELASEASAPAAPPPAATGAASSVAQPAAAAATANSATRRVSATGAASSVARPAAGPGSLVSAGTAPTPKPVLALPPRAQLAEREPLIAAPPTFDAARMMETIRFLAGPQLRGRELGSEGLDRAATFIADRFRDAYLEPGGESRGSFFETWDKEVGDFARLLPMANVVAVLPGSNPDWAGSSVVVGAHYDHLGLGAKGGRSRDRGRVHPGADDNASGVAVLLELARVMGANPAPGRTVVFVAFTGEESGREGSRRYVADYSPYPAPKAVGMINLDTVGRLGSGKLLVIGAQSAREWVHIVQGAGYVTGVKVATVKEALDSSDQVSFIKAGIPAVQLFTGAQLDYHRPTDTPEKIDAEGLVKVASVALEAITYLAETPEPLHRGSAAASGGASGKMLGRKDQAGGGSHGSGSRGSAATGPGTKPVSSAAGAVVEGASQAGAANSAGGMAAGATASQRAYLGTVPDFSYEGAGYRLDAVVPGSPAEACGLRAGDIIVGVDEKPVSGLRDLSQALHDFSAGSRVRLHYVRAGAKMTAEATLDSR